MLAHHCRPLGAPSSRSLCTPRSVRHESAVITSLASRGPGLYTSTLFRSLNTSCRPRPAFTPETAVPSRSFTTSPILRQLQQQQQKTDPREEIVKGVKEESATPPTEVIDGFQKSEKATKAAHVNLAAKLHKDGAAAGNKAGLGEIIRLLKIARPEARWLVAAFAFLLVSSAVTLSIPFTIGKMMDVATKRGEAPDSVFGLTMPQFYMALGAVRYPVMRSELRSLMRCP